MRLSPPVHPMLARSVNALPREGPADRSVFEQKVDGYRVVVFARPGVGFVQSRRGADLSGAFPEIARAAAGLGVEVVVDAELVVFDQQRLDFPALQQRARRRGASAELAARDQSAHLVVFDVLELSGTVLLDRPLHERRAVLEDLFIARELGAPWALCPQTADREVARGWLDPAWGAVGVEGVMIKDVMAPYRRGERGWLKLRARMSAEGVVGGVTGGVGAPRTVLLGRFDAAGGLRLIARSTPLSSSAVVELGAVLRPAGAEHPWSGRRFAAAWGSREPLDFQVVVPELVAEFAADTAVDRGRYRHPVRYLRLREDMSVQDLSGP
ncbi:ATP-dependent DNA ligase [Streptomyces sp. NPDC005953]|uniref:ATP-dependent DNA ligase n=3 Tax=Streptomyces TaxID=1883 RepID=UPI0033E6B250